MRLSLAEVSPGGGENIPYTDLIEGHNRVDDFCLGALARLRHERDYRAGDMIIRDYEQPDKYEGEVSQTEHGVEFNEWQQQEMSRCLRLFPEFNRGDIENLFATVVNARAGGMKDNAIFERLMRVYHPDMQDAASTATCALIMGLYHSSSPLAPSGFDL